MTHSHKLGCVCRTCKCGVCAEEEHEAQGEPHGTPHGGATASPSFGAPTMGEMELSQLDGHTYAYVFVSVWVMNSHHKLALYLDAAETRKQTPRCALHGSVLKRAIVAHFVIP